MYIEPVKCSNCGRTGRPGEKDFGSDQSAETIHCACGNAIKVSEFRDQMILSENVFCRLSGTSNYMEHGQVLINPGQATKVSFKKKIETICKVFLTCEGQFLHVKEANVNQNGMLLIAAGLDDITYTGPVKLNWMVEGLIDISALPNWYTQFYSAIVNSTNGLYKAALFEYAVAFEAFVENHARNLLESKYGLQVAEFVLKNNWKIEERVKSVFDLATGKKLSDRDDVYQPWDTNVRQIRNKLFHGTPISVSIDMVEKAHSATYQAIRYIENEIR